MNVEVLYNTKVKGAAILRWVLAGKKTIFILLYFCTKSGG